MVHPGRSVLQVTNSPDGCSAGSERGAPLTGAALAQWCYNFPNLAARTIEGLRHDAQAAVVRLEARPADDSQEWTEIFPSQLEWAAKEGHQVRAIETASQPSPAATVETRGSGVEMIDNLSPEALANWQDEGNCNAGRPQCSAATGDAVERLAEKLQQHWQGGGHAYTRPWDNGTDKDCVHGLPGQADFFRQLARIAVEPQAVQVCDQCPEPMEGPHHPECYRFVDGGAVTHDEPCPACSVSRPQSRSGE